MNLEVLAANGITPEALQEFVNEVEKAIPGFFTHGAPAVHAPADNEDALESEIPHPLDPIIKVHESNKQTMVRFSFYGEQAQEHAEILHHFFTQQESLVPKMPDRHMHSRTNKTLQAAVEKLTEPVATTPRATPWKNTYITTHEHNPCVEINAAFLKIILDHPHVVETFAPSPKPSPTTTPIHPNLHAFLNFLDADTFQGSDPCVMVFHGLAKRERAQAVNEFMNTLLDELLPSQRPRSPLEHTSLVAVEDNHQPKYALYIPRALMNAVLDANQQNPQKVREAFETILTRHSGADTGPDTRIGTDDAERIGGLPGADHIIPPSKR